MSTQSPNLQYVLSELSSLLVDWDELDVVVLFGSVASDSALPDSDLDVAVQAKRPITVEQRIRLISQLAEAFGRPVDVVDLREIGQPLLGEIVAKGIMVKGGVDGLGGIMMRSIMMQEDFVPYQKLILAGRRKLWLES